MCDKIPFETEKNLIARLAELNDRISAAVAKLEADLKSVDKTSVTEAAKDMAHIIIPDMEEVRALADETETLMPSDFYPYPTYFDLLYSVK